jgi:hypothetical protein
MILTQDHKWQFNSFRPDTWPGREPHLPVQFLSTCNIAVFGGMEAETESPILTRFEKHDEFVALQNEALSLDDGTLASDEEERRRTKLMWNVFNIVRIVVSRRFFSSRF